MNSKHKIINELFACSLACAALSFQQVITLAGGGEKHGSGYPVSIDLREKKEKV